MSGRRKFNDVWLWMWATPAVAVLISILAGSIAVSSEDDNALVDSAPAVAEAIVVEVDERSTRGGGWRYTPLVEFEATHGVVHRERLAATREEDEYVVGETITVRYYEPNPSLVYDVEHRPTAVLQWTFTWVMGAIGVVLFGVATYLTFIRRKPWKARKP